MRSGRCGDLGPSFLPRAATAEKDENEHQFEVELHGAAILIHIGCENTRVWLRN